MNMKKMMLLAATTLAGSVMADVSVEDVKCTQRYPWNGLVDIEYTIACDDPEADVYVNPVAYDGDRRLTLFPSAFTGDGATNTVKAGRHKMVWDAKKDLGSLFSSKNFQIKMYAGKRLSRYVVVDLSSGPDGENFPIRYSLTGPDISDDACRTTELWLRLIPPGTFMMGSPADELGRSDNEDLHKVTITQPFYIGVFEVTHEQWYRVMGSYRSIGYYQGLEGFPVRQVSYVMIRGSVADNNPNGTTVGEGTFFEKIRRKTRANGFDFPTEAQWEYACRCGTATALYNSRNLTGVRGCSNLNELGRYYVNGYNGGSEHRWDRVENNYAAKVGSYEPNVYGIYDLYGNVVEICRDSWTDNLGGNAVTDPLPCGSIYKSWNGSNSDSTWFSVVRGGSGSSQASECRSASRGKQLCGDYPEWIGFRISCPGNLQK